MILKSFTVFIGYFQYILNHLIKLHIQLLIIGLKKIEIMKQKLERFFLKSIAWIFPK